MRKPSDRFFRAASGRVTALLTRRFGLRHLEAVQDAVQDALIKALQTWGYHGWPENPSAWIYTSAKNRLLDMLRRNAWFAEREEALATDWESLLGRSEWEEPEVLGVLKDSELRLLFQCCHPSLSLPTQVAFTLRTLGGFNDAEIGRAFLSEPKAIERRLQRARKTLQASPDRPRDLEAGPEAMEAALHALYLLFNEGYTLREDPGKDDGGLRRELCEEALRLAALLADGPGPKAPAAEAQCALFHFQLSRFDARLDAEGGVVLLEFQDRGLWDQGRIQAGMHHLRRSARGDEPSRYHLEAGIAACHAVAPDFARTNWTFIVAHYDLLLALHFSPVIALNRALALSMVSGPELALAEMGAADWTRSLAHYYPLWVALGSLHRRAGNAAEAEKSYSRALALVNNPAVRKLIEENLPRAA